MNQVNSTKHPKRTARSRVFGFAPLAGLLLVGTAFAQVSCAEGGTVSTGSSTSTSGTQGGSAGTAGAGGVGGFSSGGTATNSGGVGAGGNSGGSTNTAGTAGSGGATTTTGSGGSGGSNCVTEICDGLDNDCDSVADNGNPGGDKSCTTNLPGVCAAGVTKCDGANGVICTATVAVGQNPETCNGMDDNCDGSVDEDDPGGGGDCMASAFGECKAGKQHCVNGALKCQPGAPAPEVCDGLDNNCDGNVDEGNPGGGLQCMTGFMGICGSGITQCDGMAGVICEPSVTPGLLTESCNGLDDDCDGQVDEGVAQVGQACNAAGFVGICQFGTFSCPALPPFQLKCDHPAPGTIQETCNGMDDDCNGSIDDPAILNNQPCNTAFPGVCMPGKTLCVGGSNSCVANVSPNQQAELCNNLDDNCNGQTDEMNPNPACTTQNPNAQFVQGWSCSGGACGILTCAAGHADIDQAQGNGCECVTDSYQNQCNLAGTVSVPAGGTVNMIGKIEQAAGSDFLTFNFTVPAVGAPYHPKIELSDSQGGQYAMDVLTDCNNAAGCSTVGAANNENGIQVNIWEQNYSAYTPGAGCCSDNTPRVGSMRVRVYRKFANQPTCASYTIIATNP